jgi:hypothetical protein
VIGCRIGQGLFARLHPFAELRPDVEQVLVVGASLREPSDSMGVPKFAARVVRYPTAACIEGYWTLRASRSR